MKRPPKMDYAPIVSRRKRNGHVVMWVVCFLSGILVGMALHVVGVG